VTAPVDPASTAAAEFTEAARPELYTLNAPAPGEVEALLADRERLTAFLRAGYSLWRSAMSRQHDSQAVDPLGGQKSREAARDAWLDHYGWLHAYGPTLLLLIDQGMLEGAVEQAYRAERAADG
jgi:hypothetical protein